ncbi:MAG: family 43 glycosylhydrolase [Clostridia bacterium]|nr:family 43 glycosylhydrolase [Clostridia bacterium]
MQQEKKWIRGANPYMPLWEHVPDGEPRVFCHDGEERVYVYGSHDTLVTEYCGKDYVVWSAPVTDLTDWTCHGVCYRAMADAALYAPDVVKKGDTYYMYAAEERGSKIYVARSAQPWGPFTDPVLTDLGFDPGILVDDDGRVYAYWGFGGSYCAELQEDMATIKPGTLHNSPIGHCRGSWAWMKTDPATENLQDAFFEASSPRKIFGKYVYIYSKRANLPQPELGVYEDNNGFLSYKWSDHPLEGYQEGGDISFNGGEILRDAQGNGTMTYRWGNNHGSVMQVNGHWYVFYHRQTGQDEYSRQAMLEPIDAAQGPDGKVYLGKITYENGLPVRSVPVEMTSQGAHINGLDARQWISAGYACHLRGGEGKAYIRRVEEQREDISAPIEEITNGTVAGYRYLQFGPNSPRSLTLRGKALADLKISVRIDAWDGKEIAEIDAKSSEDAWTVSLRAGVLGKHGVYFAFTANQSGPIAVFDCFTFDD